MTAPGYVSGMASTALVTGANRGIGREVARGLARAGWSVVLACRDPERAEGAVEALRAEAGHERVWHVVVDLTDPDAVDRAASTVIEHTARLDAVIANAGLAPVGLERTGLGVERGWHASHLGHVQLVDRLLPLLRASTPARIVALAGLYNRRGTLRLDDLGWTERPWRWAQAAADTQLARVMWVRELSEHLDGTGVTVNAVHPGAVRTGFPDDLSPAMRALAEALARIAFVEPEVGARPVLRLVLDPPSVTGRWFRKGHVGRPHPLVDDGSARRALWDASFRLLNRPAGPPTA